MTDLLGSMSNYLALGMPLGLKALGHPLGQIVCHIALEISHYLYTNIHV